VTDSSLQRTPVASLIAVLALVQAALALFVALGFVEIGGEMMERSFWLLPLGAIVVARAAFIIGIVVLYTVFAWGTWQDRPSARRFGVIAAVANLLLVFGILLQGEYIARELLWCIVPAIVIAYVLARPRAPST
jgi:amino acid transporter